jgi:hypothetical protein
MRDVKLISTLHTAKFVDTEKKTGMGETMKKPEITQGKGKAIPLQAWTGPEGSRSLRLPYFKTIGT